MTTYRRPNDVDFDHPFEIRADRSVHSHDTAAHVPDVVHVEDQQAPNDIDIQGDGWEALTGFTGQYSYNGAVMHPSEYIGGGMEDWLLAHPGVYVVTEVRDDDGQYPDESPLIGWVILRSTTEHATDCGHCAAGESQQHTYQPPEA